MGSKCSSPPAANTLQLVDGVEFGSLGREWRCKFATAGEAATPNLISSVPLEEAEKLFQGYLAKIKAIGGVERILRIACGACTDYKVIVVAENDAYGAWETDKFSPEEEFIASLSKVEGISMVEQQKYTFHQYPAIGEIKVGEDLVQLVPGVTSPLLGREWRCKFAKSDADAPEGSLINSESLVAVQKLWASTLEEVSAIKSLNAVVSRTVCGGCQDFKVCFTVAKEDVDSVSDSGFEKKFLEELTKISDVTAVEAQTYTIFDFAWQWTAVTEPTVRAIRAAPAY